MLTSTNLLVAASSAGTSSGGGGSGPAVGLIMTITVNDNDPSLWIDDVVEDITVDWGDGSTSTVTAGTPGAYLEHEYASSGNYDVEVRGRGDVRPGAHTYFASTLIDIKRWGTLFVPTTCQYMFSACFYLGTISATDSADFDLSNVTDMSYMFYDATIWNGDITGFNPSNVTNMEGMFINTMTGTSPFNQDISSWNVSNVANMNYMFLSCEVFNQDLSGWNVSNVTTHTNFDNNANAWQAANKPVFS